METIQKRKVWNKGKLVWQKPPLKQEDILAIRINLQSQHAVRDLAMFNLAIDSKLSYPAVRKLSIVQLALPLRESAF